MSRATKALAALAALAAAAAAARRRAGAAAAHPAAAGAAPANCSRHIRVGVFDDANPFAIAFLTGWMDNAATACYSFHHMPTGNRGIELLANGDLEFAVVGNTPLASAVARRRMLSLPSQSARSGTNWMKGKSFKRLSHTRSDALSPGSSPASTHSSVDPRSQHRGAFFRASVANLDA